RGEAAVSVKTCCHRAAPAPPRTGGASHRANSRTLSRSCASLMCYPSCRQRRSNAIAVPRKRVGGEFVIFGNKLQQVGQKPHKKMIAAFHSDNFALECPRTEQQHYPERTGICPRLERYCRSLGPAETPRDPAPLAPWPTRGFGGAARRRYQPNGGSQMSKAAKKSSSASTVPLTAKSSSLPASDHSTSRSANPGFKQSRVIAMLQSPQGATIA